MKAKWRLGCYMRGPEGQWQIKWFVMVEEMDNAPREKLNHEENWNNGEERFGLLITTHVCCSQFIYSRGEWGRFMVWYWSKNIVLKGAGMAAVWQSSVGSGRTSAVTITQSLCWTGAFFCLVVMDPAARLLEGTRCFYCLHGWLWKNICDLNPFKKCHVYSHSGETKLGLSDVRGERSDQSPCPSNTEGKGFTRQAECVCSENMGAGGFTEDLWIGCSSAWLQLCLAAALGRAGASVWLDRGQSPGSADQEFSCMFLHRAAVC